MKRFTKSFRYAGKGVLIALSEQRNLKVHFILAFMVILAGLYFHISEGEWYALILAIGLVLTAELINTSIENIVNLISPQHQPLAGKIKDLAAGAVLISAIVSSTVGLIIFSKYILN